MATRSSRLNKEAMMTKTYSRGALLVAALTALAFVAQWAGAVTVPYPRFAHSYSIWFARAMDQCNPTNDGPGPTVTVVNTSGVPGFGCLQRNTTTDSSITMNFARLLINEHGRIGLLGAGLPFGARVKLQLTLRATRKVNKTKHPPGSNQSVTFEDLPVTCGTAPYYFPVRSNGVVVAITNLQTCLGALQGEQAVGTNIEVLDAALVNADTGQVFGVPGIVR